MRDLRLLSTVLMVAGASLSSCEAPREPLLPHQPLLEEHDWWDNQDWAWYEKSIPFFESPDPGLDATYYYRWELLTKHLIYGSPESGYTFTEFIDRPFWSGTFGAISCPLGHQAYEIRWLKDRRIIQDFSRYWFETPGAQPRSYSNWYGDAMWGTYQVLGDSTFLRAVYPHMESQVAGWTRERWDPEHEMYRWVGAWDGMETNINSRLTSDEFGGGEGYRPTLNAYLYADLAAISRTASLFGEDEKAAEYGARASALKERVQEELWDPDRAFFFHQFAHDEKDGIRAKSLTYQTGPYAGDSHGRELLGYVPWQFNLPDPGYEVAWRYLMGPDYFWADYGPTGVEQGDPQFFVSPRCCVWSGNAWPYATAQTLTAMANLLNGYDQEVVDAGDYWTLFRTYALSHRRKGRPYIGEAADPFTGSWDGHNTFYHSEHYLHSGFVDQLVTGLVGLRPRADDTLQVNPLAPEAWDYFALEGVDYHGHALDIVWDRDGSRYGRGEGLSLYLNGQEVGRRAQLGEIRVAIPAPSVPQVAPRLNNYAVNNQGGHFPFAWASASHPLFPPFYAVDGNRWYHPSPPNRWVAGTDDTSPVWFQVDFGVERALSQVELYFLDDASGPAVEAVGEEASSGFPLHAAQVGVPILPPAAFEVEYWDGEGWRPIPEVRRSPEIPTGRRSNQLTFPEIRAASLRATFTPQEGATLGLTEFEAWGQGPLPPPTPEAPVPNLALNVAGEGYPRISASYTYQADSPWQAVDGRLALTRYSRNRWTAFQTTNQEDWLEVDFGEMKRVGRVEIFLYGDGRGVAAPKAYRVQVWTEGSWREVTPSSRTPEAPLAWAMNRVEFEQETTERIRVTFRHAGPMATGVAEFRVFP
jgi:hypothetical protein